MRNAARIQGHFRGTQRAFREPPRIAGADPNGGERHAAGIVLGQLTAEGIAHVEDDVLQVRSLEQARLRGAVGAHGLVIVQVIAAQIGERGGMKAHAGDAILIEGLRGYFHRHLAHAGGAQLRELAVQGDRVGRGERGRRRATRHGPSRWCRCRQPATPGARDIAPTNKRRWSCRWSP